MLKKKETIRNTVQDYYTKKVETNDSCCGSIALYSPELLINLPEEVMNFSLGCGNPVIAANLQPGEIVLDLGSGGGLDCFLSARAVGETGHVIGIDMTPKMIDRATDAAFNIGVKNVEFCEGYLESLPVESNSIDVVISNCVINLSTDKKQVFSEIYRALKSGGRICISDIVSNGKIPSAMLQMEDSWSSCIAGALPFEKYINDLSNAGFIEIEVAAKNKHGGIDKILPDKSLFSAIVTAKKP
jgi:SAM-dependent methyltransferase